MHGLDGLYDQMKNVVDVCRGTGRIPGFGKGFKVDTWNFAWYTSMRDIHDQCKRYTVNPLLSCPLPGGLFICSLFEGALNRDGGLFFGGAGGGGGLFFNLGTTMVSVLHKELAYKVEKLQYKKVGGHAAEDQNQI